MKKVNAKFFIHYQGPVHTHGQFESLHHACGRSRHMLIRLTTVKACEDNTWTEIAHNMLIHNVNNPCRSGIPRKKHSLLRPANDIRETLPSISQYNFRSDLWYRYLVLHTSISRDDGLLPRGQAPVHSRMPCNKDEEGLNQHTDAAWARFRKRWALYMPSKISKTMKEWKKEWNEISLNYNSLKIHWIIMKENRRDREQDQLGS